LEQINLEKEFQANRSHSFGVLILVLANIAILTIAIYLSFYFDMLFLKAPLAFYVVYNLAVAVSFPVLDASYSDGYRRFSDNLTIKVIMNFIAISSLYLTKEGYFYLKQNENV
jgi:hypothetical protein